MVKSFLTNLIYENCISFLLLPWWAALRRDNTLMGMRRITSYLPRRFELQDLVLPLSVVLLHEGLNWFCAAQR
jgi:hypothetical protein